MSSTFLYGVAESSTGVVVTGGISAPADLGGALLTPMGATDSVIAQFATSDGAHMFSNRFGGGSAPGTSYVYGLFDTLDSAGLPLIHGLSQCDSTGTPACTSVDVGNGPVRPGGGNGVDGFVGRFSIGTGSALWMQRLVGPGEDQVTATAIGPGGSVFIAGWFDQSTTLLGGRDSVDLVGGGDRDVLIARLNASNGEIQMTKTFAGPGFEHPTSLAWSGDYLIAAGFFSGTSTFGPVTLNADYFDVWVAKLLPEDGTPVWAVRLGGAGPDKYPRIALDSAGDVYVTGTVTGAASMGAFSVGGAGGIDVFVAKLRASDGSVVWATSFGSSGDDDVKDIAVDRSAGRIVISGAIAGPIEPGGTFHGGSDAIVISYDGGGVPRWTKVIGTPADDGGWGIVHGSEAIYANINLGADIGPTIDGVPVVGAPKPHGVLVRLAR